MQSKNDTIKSWATKLDSHGRVVIPKELRDSKRLQHGDELVLILENGQIVLQTYEDAMQRLQDAFCKGLDPKVSLVDELIANREQAAALEARR